MSILVASSMCRLEMISGAAGVASAARQISAGACYTQKALVLQTQYVQNVKALPCCLHEEFCKEVTSTQSPVQHEGSGSLHTNNVD